MERLAQKVTNLIQLNNPHLNDLEIIKIKFGLECFFGEMSKLFMYIIIFSIFSLAKYFIVAALFFGITRMAAGGYHEETYWRCFITSLFIFSSIVLLGINILFSFKARFVIFIVIIGLMGILAPVDHPNKPIISKIRRKRLKYISLLITVLFIILSFLLPEKSGNVGIIALLSEAILLPVGEISKRRHAECKN